MKRVLKEIDFSKDIKLEPDQFVRGEYHGYKWLVIRQPKPMGHLCGYVKIPDKHPYINLLKKKVRFKFKELKHEHYDYDALPIECHGGLTFAEKVDDSAFYKNLGFSKGWWIGWDYAHAFDEVIIDLPDYKKRIEGNHWEVEDVIRECWNVIQQLKEASPEIEYKN